MAQIKILTENRFEEEVLNNPKPVLVDFWAPWCGPCRMLAPAIEAIATKYDGLIEVGKINVDENPGLAQALQIMSIPVVALFSPGKPPVALLGVRPQADLEKALGLDKLRPN